MHQKLKNLVKETGKNIEVVPFDSFKEVVDTLSKEEQEELLNKLRKSREFFMKVLKEEQYENLSKRGTRFKETEKALKATVEKGKYVKSLTD